MQKRRHRRLGGPEPPRTNDRFREGDPRRSGLEKSYRLQKNRQHHP